jgi:hypothetical protein
MDASTNRSIKEKQKENNITEQEKKRTIETAFQLHRSEINDDITNKSVPQTKI